MRITISELYHSSTITTWASYAAKTLSLILVLPLILSQLSAGEIALWYLFASLLAMQALGDMGFAPTFIRSIAYAMGGAREIKLLTEVGQTLADRQPNWKLVGDIWGSMKSIYFHLSMVSIIILGGLGSAFLIRPISQTDDLIAGWFAWGVILITSFFSFYGSIYSTYLQGINEIALLRRWETVASIGATITSFVVLIFGGGLFALVLSNQIWGVLSVIRNKWLCFSVASGRFRDFSQSAPQRDVIKAVWPTSWRSGLGILMSYGIVHATGIVYAQIGTTVGIAGYLLVLRMIQTISLFSQAPFYSKLPLLARFRSEGKVEEQIKLAEKGMRMGYWTFAIGFIATGALINPFLKIINSNIYFIDPSLWSLMGLAFFVERYGAMHIQLYSTTNHIIWHIANGMSGVLAILTVVILFGEIGVYSFPVGILAGYLGFYCWYAAIHSYGAFEIRILSFERKTVLYPLIVILVFIAASGLGYV